MMHKLRHKTLSVLGFSSAVSTEPHIKGRYFTGEQRSSNFNPSASHSMDLHWWVIAGVQWDLCWSWVAIPDSRAIIS